MESLSVSIRDLAGLDGLRPVTGGVPLAEGAAPAGVVFRLSDAQGGPVPLQAEVLGRWGDGSARWVLLDFQADPPAGGQKTYALSWGDGEALFHPEAVVCEERTLQTGDASLEPGDDVLLRVADRFDIQLVLTDADGRVCRAVTESVEVETAGPLRSTLALKGTFRSPDGERLFQFRMRAALHAGLSLVSLEPGVVIDAEGGMVQRFRSLELNIRPRGGGLEAGGGPKADGIEKARLGGDPGWEGKAAARLWQRDDRSYVLEGGAAAGQGGQAPGWVEFADERGAAAVGMRDFWRQWPKSLEVEADGIGVGLFPRFEEGAYTHMEPWYKYQYLFDGNCYRLRAGQARRWQVWLDLRGDGESLGRLIEAPPVVVADPAQAIATGVWDDIAPAGLDEMAEYDTWAENLFDAYCHSVEAQRDFGELNWGDWFGERKVNWGNHEYDTTNQILVQFARTGEPRYFHWADAAARHSAEVDTVHHVNADLAEYFAQWERSGYPPRPGMVHQHAVGHVGGFYSVEQVARLFAEVGNGRYLCLDPFNLGHIFTQGLVRHYFLTGDPFVRETVEEIGDNLARLVEDREYKFMGTTHCGRVAGWTLLALAGAYELGFEERYLKAMKTLVDDALADQDPVCGGWLIHPMAADHCICKTARHTGMAGFITAVLINGMSRYYLLSGDERLPEAIARAVTFLDNDTWREEWRDWRYTSCPATGPTHQPGVVVMAHVNAVRIADQDEHLRVLRAAWETKFARLLQAPKPGPGQGKAYSSIMYGCPEAIGLLAKRS